MSKESLEGIEWLVKVRNDLLERRLKIGTDRSVFMAEGAATGDLDRLQAASKELMEINHLLQFPFDEAISLLEYGGIPA